jgi:hypothetical protein
MQPYLDVGFLLTVLVRTDGAPAANRILRRLGAPFVVNFLHQLQVENLLVSCQKSAAPERQALGNEGFRTWRNYLSEGVFQLTPADWDSAFRLALTWNSQAVAEPHLPLLLLHPALAAVGGASHFLSFDPRSRAVARAAGLKVLPERL